MTADRECSNCGRRGHNSRTCTAQKKGTLKLFGVRIKNCSLHDNDQKKGDWNDAEHSAFLIGLQEVGSGNWKKISQKYVKTRSATQVASHAQKYFKRKRDQENCKRRKSIFDQSVEQELPVLQLMDMSEKQPASSQELF